MEFPGLLHEVGLSPHASEVLSVKVEVARIRMRAPCRL